jgi:hypothetical protein
MVNGQASFYFRPSRVGASQMVASAQNVESATQSYSVQAGSATQFIFTTLRDPTPANSCSPSITLKATDGDSNSTAADNVTVLADTPSTALFLDTGFSCSQPLPNPLFVPATGVSLRFIGFSPGIVTLSASSPGASGTATYNIDACAPAGESCINTSCCPGLSCMLGACGAGGSGQ